MLQTLFIQATTSLQQMLQVTLITALSSLQHLSQFGTENVTHRIRHAGRYKSSAIVLEAFSATDFLTVYIGVSIFDLVYAVDCSDL